MREDVTVYYITGKQLGPLTVPGNWCAECDLTVRAVEAALLEVDPDCDLTFVAKPWMRHAIPALLKGGWHPPVVVVDGKVHSQGVVPRSDELAAALRSALVAGSKGRDYGLEMSQQ
jgi:hypothetical protein